MSSSGWDTAMIEISVNGWSTYCATQNQVYNVDITGSIPAEWEAYEIIADSGCIITWSTADADASGHSTGSLELKATGTSGIHILIWALDENGQRLEMKTEDWPGC
jgi:hypothetical protein